MLIPQNLKPLFSWTFLTMLSSLLVTAVIAFEVEMETEPWITMDEDGRLVYRTDERGNTIPDFSRAGYRGGGVALPILPVIETLETPGDSDATEVIQKALDRLGNLPANEEGHRGALLLRRGVYVIDGSLVVPAGVVLRGEGQEESDTVLTTNVLNRRPLVRLGRSDGDTRTTIPNTERKIKDTYVPWSSRNITLAHADDLSPGDRVVVVRIATPEWISLIGMDRIAPRPNPEDRLSQWTADDYTLHIERFVESVAGNTITLDAPVMVEIDQEWGGGYLYRVESQRAFEIGIENLRIVVQYPEGMDQTIRDMPEGVRFERAENSWARNITSVHTHPAFSGNRNSMFLTIADTQHLDPIGPIRGGFRYTYNINSSYSLVINGFARNARHAFSTGSRAAGPTVFLEGRSTQTHNDSGPHHRFAFGQLYDLIEDDHSINVQDRGNWGTGHGWAGAQQVFWNVTTPRVTSQQAPTTRNFVVGGFIEEIHPGRLPDRQPGSFDRVGEIVEPRSLYRAQLIERLGTDVTH